METKRCLRCHKLLRAEAQVCSRCGGHEFSRATQTKQKTRAVLIQESSAHTSHPPASPHRAGHYSGLHPEDQPYQSSFLPAQRPPASVQPVLDVINDEPGQEEEEIVSYPTRVAAPETPLPIMLSNPAPQRRVAELSPLPQPRPQRGASFSTKKLEPQLVEPAAPLPRQAAGGPITPAPPVPRRRKRRSAVPLLLITSGFLFLVATSILVFLLFNTRPQTQLKPVLFVEPTGALRAGDILLMSGSRFLPGAPVRFTYDAHLPVLDANGHQLVVNAYATGTFSVQITIPTDWAEGNHVIYATDQQNDSASAIITIAAPLSSPPRLQLANAHLDFGEDSAGTVAHKMLTLVNTGGGQIHWRASSDSSSWLTVQPGSGTFAGKALVTITVNRGSLAPQAYSGHILFSQQDAAAISLTVTMAVNPASANLVLSAAALTFNGTSASNPANQPITIQNTGGQPLNWNASLSVSGGGNWLSLSPMSGQLAAGAQAAIAVGASSIGLGVGTYSGTVTFSYAGASSTPVSITLIVSPPPVAAISVRPASLAFNAIQGQNPLPQSFTITDSGNAPLNWSIVPDGNGQAYTPVSQSRGTLAPSKSIVITVSPTISSLSASVVNAQLMVVDTDSGTPVKSQPVKIAVTIVNQAVINVSVNAMSFSHDSVVTVSTALLILTNTGSAPLNWAITIQNGSPVSWLSVDIASGTLGPGTTDLVNVTVDSSHLSPGTFVATLRVSDTDAGTPVAPQTITVTVVVT